ncbi:MAG: MotA/TolQ/ExbB proton channel family protein [Novosphingobium sp.]|nr:MotA/TolQ/ExbB proton channel family protein [Novosphingobium sp.]
MTLIDPTSLALVWGGALAGGLLRTGPRAFGAALKEALRLPFRRFDTEKVRAALAGQINSVRSDGLIRARLHDTGDPVFDQAVASMLLQRSVKGLHPSHSAYCGTRGRSAQDAAMAWATTAELAPAFGLVGTLLSLSQLPTGSFDSSGFNAAISGAVLTTLYGVLLANLLFAPLAEAISRAAEHERAQRQSLIDWLELQIEEADPHHHDFTPRVVA